MEMRKGPVLLILLYPFTLVTIAAGFLAFVMLVMRLDFLVVSSVVLWFYSICAASIYLITARALRKFGLHRLFLGFVSTFFILAVLSTVLFVLENP